MVQVMHPLMVPTTSSAQGCDKINKANLQTSKPDKILSENDHGVKLTNLLLVEDALYYG